MRHPFPLAENVDGILLLIARGAKVEDAANAFGVSGATLTRRMPVEYPDAYRAALEARRYLARPHATRQRYVLGCRCRDCTDANRLYQRGLKDKTPPNHGTISAYRNFACRCEPCKAAGRARTR